MSFTDDSFLHFLLQAKHHTYASQSADAAVTPLLPGSQQLEYRDGNFFYRDIYVGRVGMAYFVGQEIVYHQDQPLWSMSYAGGVTPTLSDRNEIRSIYAFLRMALRQVSIEHPYRGALLLRDTPYMYTNQSQGTRAEFWGHELITRDDLQVYQLHYSGGFLR